ERLMSVTEIKAFDFILFEPMIDYAQKKKIYKQLPVFGLEPITKVITQKPALPAYNLMTNGRYYLALDDEGNGSAVLNGITLNKECNFCNGVNLFLDGQVIKLMTNPLTVIQNSSYSHYKYKHNNITFELKIAVMQDYDGEIRSLIIVNDGSEKVSCKVAFFIEPVLTF